jgi:hypothetical protein
MGTKINNNCTCPENTNHNKDGKLHHGFYKAEGKTVCKKCNGVLRPPFSL